jgi:hypothetical protein
MSEFSQDSRPIVAEDMPPTAFRVQAGDDAQALNANFHPSAVIEPYDAQEGRLPAGLVDPILGDFEAKSVASGSTDNVPGSTAEANKVCTPRTPVLPFKNLDHQTFELHAEVKRRIARRTHLADGGSALVAFWALSTWFREALEVFPLLLVSGPAHEAFSVLNVLHELCYQPSLRADFKRRDLKDLRGGTLLVSEPTLDNRTAALLGNLTNRNFLLVEESSLLGCAGSMAIYVGENSAIKRIPHSIHVHMAPALAHDAVGYRSAREKIDGVRNRILAYRNRHLAIVKCLEFNPRGLSSEVNVIANALGSCIVGAPQLQSQLVALLKPQAQQQVADRSSGDEALVLVAALALCCQDKGEVFVKEIAAEVNRLLAARGETRQLSPEKVGHKLKKVGLFTRRLSHAGNGLILDQATTKRLCEVAAAYLGEDLIPEDENFHCSLRENNEALMEDMEDMKDLPL